MDICRETPPPLFKLDPARAASCFLYRDTSPELPLEELSTVMETSDPATA
jgi:hypothetical protein